jgi:hypothetical protein
MLKKLKAVGDNLGRSKEYMTAAIQNIMILLKDAKEPSTALQMRVTARSYSQNHSQSIRSGMVKTSSRSERKLKL